MTVSLLAPILTGLLLIWRLALDYIPLGRLNDLSRKSARSRRRDFTIHYIPLALIFLLSLLTYRTASAVAVVLALAYAAVQVINWWLPYFRGGTDSQKARWEGAYGRTHRILPRIKDHSVPDTSHLITGILTVVVFITLGSHLLAGPSVKETSAKAPDNKAGTGAAAPTQTPLVETAFTQAGQKPDQLLITAIQSAKKSIDIAINAINHEEIVKAIVQARINGVEIRIITDRSESTNTLQAEKLKTLLNAGIPVKENARKGLMNLKLAVFDDHTGATGSFNYTENASNANDELLVLIHNTETVAGWKKRFEDMWADKENYKDLQIGVVQKK
jgi:phosphatidylserine/phosphatidylglycerophosphate/cardiolipin synthase-like enzyme